MKNIWYLFLEYVEDCIEFLHSYGFIKKPYYKIETNLNPYCYHEIDERMFHGIFALIVEFIEKECAHMYEICYESNHTFSQAFKGTEYLRLHFKENKQCGVDADWISDVLDLYYWYKERDEMRHKDEVALGGAEDYDDCVYNSEFDMHTSSNYFAELGEMMDRHKNEDTDMMIRAIKIRGYLWT